MFIIPFHYNLRRVGREGAKYGRGAGSTFIHSTSGVGGNNYIENKAKYTKRPNSTKMDIGLKKTRFFVAYRYNPAYLEPR